MLLKKNVRLEELKIGLNIIQITPIIIIIIIILYFRIFLLPLFGIEEEKKDIIYPFYISFPTISLIILQNIPPAPVWNRGKGGRHYITSLYVPANLDEAIANLHRQQQANQVQVEPMAQINEMVIEWRNEGNNALDYDKQQANKDGDQNVDQSYRGKPWQSPDSCE